MSRPRTRPIIKIKCAYCGKEMERAIDVRRSKNNFFCSMDHRNLYKIGRSRFVWRTDELIKEYKRLVEYLGKFPSLKEIKEHGKISYRVFQNRFGTLDNLKKLSYPGINFNQVHRKEIKESIATRLGFIDDTDTWSIEDISDSDGGWFSAMCNGEGCFRVQMRGETKSNFTAVFSIQLRADDIQSLMEMKRIIGYKKHLSIWDRAKDVARGINAGDGVKLHIRDIPFLFYRLIPILEKYPMRGKKQNELPIFKRGVKIFIDKRASGRNRASFTPEEREELEQIYWCLREMKKYKSNLRDIMKEYPVVRVGK